MFITTTIMAMFSQSSHYYITVQIEKAKSFSYRRYAYFIFLAK